MATKVISFINFKGGVGKTASTVNLAACLAAYHRKKVLVVDLDPQCNSSLWLLQPEEWRKHVDGAARSVHQLFRDHINGTHVFDFDQAVIRGVPRRDGYPLISHLDLLPASVDLLRIEDQIYQNKYSQFFTFLHKSLKPHFSEYDYVFFDCPPNLYAVTKNALFASDYCLVPYVPDYLSLSGFQVLAEEVDLFAHKISGFVTGRRRVSIAALLVSHYRKVGNVFDHSINELEIQLAQIKAAGQVHPKTLILHPYIRHCVAVAESTSEHLPVTLHKQTSNGAQDYYQLAQSFDQHFGSLK
ncbi:MAG: ParA family protein [Blastochloris sp.]|nr:ParA family protein [Blastochloris sp.]